MYEQRTSCEILAIPIVKCAYVGTYVRNKVINTSASPVEMHNTQVETRIISLIEQNRRIILSVRSSYKTREEQQSAARQHNIREI